MLTADATLDALHRYDIGEEDLFLWEQALGLDIPQDNRGQKIYSPHHINLFKNVKKHLALGRTLAQIKSIISLPPNHDAVVMNPGNVAAAMSAVGIPAQDLLVKETILQAPVLSTEISTSNGHGQKQLDVASDNADAQKTVIKAQPYAAPKSPYASLPQRPAKATVSSQQLKTPQSQQGAKEVVALVKKLSSEKDHLYGKLLETEKLNSHLYSANNMYHRRVKELEASLQGAKSQLPLELNVKLMDDKARLHKQIIDADKRLAEQDLQLKQSNSAVLELSQTAQRVEETDKKLSEQALQLDSAIHQLQQANNAVVALSQSAQRLNEKITELSTPSKASAFCGDWMESGQLVEIVYDNFGINVEPERVRLFRVSKAPDHVYGNTAIITTSYQYESNAQWKRQETLIASIIPNADITKASADVLEGEVIAEYILDGVPVAKATYRVTCRRHH